MARTTTARTAGSETYERPSLTVLGTVADLTRGTVAVGNDKNKTAGLTA